MLFNTLDLGRISVMLLATETNVIAAVKASMALPSSKTPTEMMRMSYSRSHDTIEVASTTSGVTLQA